jgi:hypothetical protein
MGRHVGGKKIFFGRNHSSKKGLVKQWRKILKKKAQKTFLYG